MDVLTFEICWAVNGEIIKQVTSSWSIFIQLWLNYIEQMIPELSGAWYTIRLMVYISNITTLKINLLCILSFYYNIWNYFLGQFFKQWDDLHFTEENRQIVAGAQPRTSCRSLFKQLKNLPVPCQCTLSLRNFIINNQENFQTNSSVHSINTWRKDHLHRQNANLSCFQKSTFYVGIKIVDSWTHNLTILKKDKAKFKAALRI